MKELTVDIDDFRKRLRDSQYFIGAQESILHLLELSRVLHAAPGPDVMYGPCELRPGVWVEFYVGAETICGPRIVARTMNLDANWVGVRVGDVPACPPPKPAPPMPEGDPPKRIIARKDGKAYHGAITGEGIVHIFGAVAYLNADYARNCGWEIEILEGRDDGK